MRKLYTWTAVAALTALLTAGVAVATQRQGKTQSDSVAATFTATQSRIKESTCAGQDGTYRQFHGSWSGTATGDPRLTGTFRLRAKGLINTTTNRGQVEGLVWIRGEKGATVARLAAVYRDGQLHGLVYGRVRDRQTAASEEVSGGGRLIGLVESTFPATGPISGRIGGSGPTIMPARVQSGGCDRGKHDKRGKRR